MNTKIKVLALVVSLVFCRLLSAETYLLVINEVECDAHMFKQIMSGDKDALKNGMEKGDVVASMPLADCDARISRFTQGQSMPSIDTAKLEILRKNQQAQAPGAVDVSLMYYNVGVTLEAYIADSDGGLTVDLSYKKREFEGFMEYGSVSITNTPKGAMTSPSGVVYPVFVVQEVQGKFKMLPGEPIILTASSKEEVRDVYEKGEKGQMRTRVQKLLIANLVKMN